MEVRGTAPGNVGYTVVDYAVYQEGWIGVGCRLTGLNATALVDCDVDNDGTGRHAAYHVPGDDLRGLGPGNQDTADHEVGFSYGSGGGVYSSGNGDQIAAQYLLHLTQPPYVGVDKNYLCSEAQGYEGGVGADHAGAYDGDGTRRDARHTGEQLPYAAVLFFQEMGTNLHRNPSCNLAHGGEERKATIVILYGLIGEGGDSVIKERFG